VRHSADELAVLDDRRARHECGQVGTTQINEKIIIKIILVSKFRGLDIYARFPSVSRSS
jgi:hypothetical protein